jgi:hypothetical protein
MIRWSLDRRRVMVDDSVVIGLRSTQPSMTAHEKVDDSVVIDATDRRPLLWIAS